MNRGFAACAVTLLLFGCDASPTEDRQTDLQGPSSRITMPHRNPAILHQPDHLFRLSPEQRKSLHPGYEPEAIERLLSWIRPELREEFLRGYQWNSFEEFGSKTAVGEVTIEIDHPEIQKIMKAVVRRNRSLP